MDTIRILQRVAEAQATKNPKTINAICAELADHVLKIGYSAEELIEPLAIMARAATDVRIRIHANYAVARFSERDSKEQKPAIDRFLKDVSALPDIRKRLDLFLRLPPNNDTIGCAAALPRAAAGAALELAKQFPTVAERAHAYERVRKYTAFSMEDLEQRTLAGLFEEARGLPAGDTKAEAYWDVLYRASDKKMRVEAVEAYLEAVGKTRDVQKRVKKYSSVAHIKKLPLECKTMALDCVFEDIEKIKSLEDRAEHYRFVLSEFPGLAPYAQMAAAGTLKMVGRLSDPKARVTLYRLAARSAKGDQQRETVNGFAGEVRRMDGVQAQMKACEDMIRNTDEGSGLREVSIEIWQESLGKLSVETRPSTLRDHAYSYFSLSGKDFRTAYKMVFAEALKGLPDAESRTNACIDLALASDRYGCDLSGIATQGFRKHLNEIPDKKRRMDICGSLMSEEQTMLQPPPLESAASDEYCKLADEEIRREDVSKATLLKKIRSQDAGL